MTERPSRCGRPLCAGRWGDRRSPRRARCVCLGVLGCGRTELQVIEWTPDPATASVEDVGVDHGGADAAVAEELLNGADVITVFQ